MRLGSRPRSVLRAAIIGLGLLTAAPVHAGPPTDRLREFFFTVNVILTDPATQSQPLEKVARVKRLVTDIADVRAAAAALDREWDARTPSERDEFTRLFGELLERGLVARLAGTVSPVHGMVMSWRGESHVGDEARVMTLVEARDGRKMQVEYRMAERRGRWLVRDVVVDGVSTIDNYRSQFKRLLRHGSYSDLVTQLRAKLHEETLMFAQAPASALQSAPKPADTVATLQQPEPHATTPSAPPAVSARAPARAVTPTLTVRASSKTVAATSTPPASVTSPGPATPDATRLSVPASTPPASPESGAPAVSKAPVLAAAPGVAKPPILVTAPARNRPRANVVSTNPTAPPAAAPLAADVISPVGVLEASAHLLPSVLLLALGFGGVSGAVFLRRRVSAETLVCEPLRDRDERLVLVHPVTRVPRVRERRRKRRIVPAPRNPARHVDDAHGA